MLFAAISWCGIVFGLPAGFLADRYGAKNLLFICVVTNIAGTLLTPVTAINVGYMGVFVLRCLIGIGQVSAFFNVVEC